jgi:hypothetical protein
MPYSRVADFEADDAAIDAFVEMVKADPKPPEGVPSRNQRAREPREGQDARRRLLRY